MAVTERDLYAARDVLVGRYLQPAVLQTVKGLPIVERSVAVLAAAPRTFWGERAIRMRPSHVHAVGIGGKNDGTERAVVVYITHKLPRSAVPAGEFVPESIDGVPTDVVESRVPRLAACTDNRFDAHRPLIAGVSVGRDQGPSGTIGAFARSTRTGDPPDALLLLSNSHVLAAGRTGPNVRVVQPSSDDGAGESVGTVLRATRLTTTRPIGADAAVVLLDSPAGVRNEVCMVGAITAAADPAEKDRVEKHGRTTGHTTGVIKTIGLAAEALDGQGRRLQFLNVFRVEQEPGSDGPLADLGDSGALVVREGAGIAVGMLYAADELTTFYLAQPILEICKEMEIELKLE